MAPLPTAEAGATVDGRTASGAAALQLVGLRCVRAKRVLFSDLSLSIPGGHVLRVQGANGAGKTSLLRMICGLLSPHEGQVLWHGRPINTLREEYGRQLTFFGHAIGVKPELTALENLQVLMALSGFKPDTAAALLALQNAGLAGHEHALVRTLSQGQRRRAALARLMLVASPLWVLDEPFNALDQTASQWLLGLITAQAARGGIVVLTSHQSVALDPTTAQLDLAL